MPKPQSVIDRQEKERIVWVIYSATGMIVDGFLSFAGPWAKGNGAEMADAMFKTYRERFRQGDQCEECKDCKCAER